MIMEQLDQLKPFQARSVIEELRKGSVPVDYVPFFTVGREHWLKFIDDDLDNYIAEGGAKVRFISGDYGDGKTHFMSVISNLALEKGFAVSFVVLTREVPIHKFEAVCQSVARQLRGAFDGNGIRGLLDHWTGGLKEIGDIPDQLRSLPGMNINFANALIALLNNRLTPLAEGEDEEERVTQREILFHWFEGGKVTKRELKPFGIFEVLNKSNSKHLLNSMIAFLRYLGYKGLILLMDELETVIAHSTSIRNSAYENVRLLIDNTEHAKHLHIFFSIIPDVLLSEKGFKSYDALWSRVRSIGEGKRLNYRCVLIDLHRTPLKTKELVALGGYLRRIHEISYRWQGEEMVNDKLIEDICRNQKRMGMLSEVRLFVKQVIRILDMAEQGVNPEELDMAEQIVASQQEMEQEKVEQLQPKWDS
ncbi:DUF2791 family P-loop domain-containing protein [Desulfococcaceae bacterium HSG8]|nr:DUF2791 family P-loop domain-containing protein [Desulfococcaceae bacterium HSG8]